MTALLAEAVSFTEEEILVILLVLLGMLLVAVSAVVLGCIWAWRAGRGSQLALGGFAAVVGLEALATVARLPDAVGGDVAMAPAAVIALQVALYLTARGRGRSGR